MNLNEYIVTEKEEDRNIFWKLDCGDHDHLLWEAIERLYGAEDLIRQLYKNYHYNKETEFENTIDSLYDFLRNETLPKITKPKTIEELESENSKLLAENKQLQVKIQCIEKNKENDNNE